MFIVFVTCLCCITTVGTFCFEKKQRNNCTNVSINNKKGIYDFINAFFIVYRYQTPMAINRPFFPLPGQTVWSYRRQPGH